MSILHKKRNEELRKAILHCDIEKARKLLALRIGKADAFGYTEKGGFSMLHVAAMSGNRSILMMLLQFGVDINQLSHEGYSPLDMAIWKNQVEGMELLRSLGAVAPIKEPESLNGRRISHLGRVGLVLEYVPRERKTAHENIRKIQYEDDETHAASIICLYSGHDYRILPDNKRASSYGIRVIVPEEMQTLDSATKEGRREKEEEEIVLQEDSSDTEENLEIASDNIIEIHVPPGPLGILLDSMIDEYAIVQGFTTLPSGEKGLIERSGEIVPGMAIISINEVNTCLLQLNQITQLLGRLSRKEKVIRFAKLKNIDELLQNKSSLVPETDNEKDSTAEEAHRKQTDNDKSRA